MCWWDICLDEFLILAVFRCEKDRLYRVLFGSTWIIVCVCSVGYVFSFQCIQAKFQFFCKHPENLALNVHERV